MSVSDYLRLRYLTHLSKPSGDRLVYRVIDQRQIRTILEVGIGTAQRAQRMIEVAALHRPLADIQYTGVDRFEARPVSEPGLSLKAAHCLLQATGARVRLLPGDSLSVLTQAASTLRGIDLVVISANPEDEALARAWFYLPRVLHPQSLVLLAEGGEEGQFRSVSMAEIETHAVAALRRRAA